MAPLIHSLVSSVVDSAASWPVVAGAVAAVVVLVAVLVLCLGHGNSANRNNNDVINKRGEHERYITPSVAL